MVFPIRKLAFNDWNPVTLTNAKTINDVSLLSGARKLVEFLQSVIPIRSQHAKKLISHDCSSNVYNYKYTSSVEVVPICKVLSQISLYCNFGSIV